MRIKKKTGLMMIAASSAAIVGVAAVSFAAWTGSTQSALSASAQTGTVKTFGFDNTDDLTLLGTQVGAATTTSALVPYDQPEVKVNVGSYMVSTALPTYTVYAEAYTISVKAEASAQVGDSYTLYAKLVDKDETVTAPTAATGLTGWTELSGDTVMYNGNTGENPTAGAGEELKLYVVLESTGAAPTSTVTFNFDVTLTSASHTNA